MIFSLFDNLSPFSFSASSIEYKALGVALIALTAVITCRTYTSKNGSYVFLKETSCFT